MIAYIILGVLVIALIYSLLQMRKRIAWARPVVSIIAVATIITALVNMVLQTREPPYRPD